MFEWVGAHNRRPLLAACLLLALVFLATALILRFVAVAETQVDTPAVSNVDQFSEADASHTVDALGAPGPGRAHQVTTGESHSGSTPSSISVDVPRSAWSPTARLSIHSSNPDGLTVARLNAQPAPLPNTDDGSRAFTAPTDTSPHKRTNHNVVIVSPTSHSGAGGTGSDVNAAVAADGTSIRDEPSLQHVDSSGGGSFAARLHRRIKGIANAAPIGTAVGGTGGPALEAHDQHNGSGSDDVWRGTSRAQTDLGARLGGFAADPPDVSRRLGFEAPSPDGKSPWSETLFDNAFTNTARESLVPRAANDATGAPTISGVAQVGHELTASTAGISDTDGNTQAEAGDAGYAYTYQWVRVDGTDESDISGATSMTYKAVSADAGKTLKVKVSFVDDADNDEGPLTSAATATVVVPEVTIVADSSSALHRIDDVTFTLTRTESPAKRLKVHVEIVQDPAYLANRFRTVTFSAGSTTAKLRLPSSQLRIFEVGDVMRNGTLTASLADRSYYDVATPASATVDIIVPVMFTLELSSNTVSEESGDQVAATLIIRTGEGAPVPDGTITISVLTRARTATSPIDFAPQSSLFFPRPHHFEADGSAYKAEGTLEIPIVNDNFPDSGETFDVIWEEGAFLSNSYWNNFVDSEGRRCSTPCGMTVTITDDDPDGTYIENLGDQQQPGGQCVVPGGRDGDGRGHLRGRCHCVLIGHGTRAGPDHRRQHAGGGVHGHVRRRQDPDLFLHHRQPGPRPGRHFHCCGIDCAQWGHDRQAGDERRSEPPHPPPPRGPRPTSEQGCEDRDERRRGRVNAGGSDQHLRCRRDHQVHRNVRPSGHRFRHAASAVRAGRSRLRAERVSELRSRLGHADAGVRVRRAIGRHGR